MKEYCWTLEKDGETHTISCQTNGTRYILWADDDHIKTIYRKAFQNPPGSMDETLGLFGTTCHLVV